ncbi:MAG: sel1 repeat family protein [Deltaproteobacteria bacterium]|jgi:TPR repeat protein|nr:sel1 repeat family protein [Deltaproteobacteria bacterium]
MFNKARLYILIVLLAAWASPALAQPAKPAAPAQAAPAQAAPSQQALVNQPNAEAQAAPSPQELFDQLNKDAQAGNPVAMVNLGLIHANADLNKRNYGISLDWYKKAAAKNLPEGHYYVGTCYEIGQGTKTDLKAAFQSYEKAANLGLSPASFKLSRMYAIGQGVAADQGKALEYLKKSAEANYPPAINELGAVNILGQLGIKSDPKTAFDLFTKATKFGNSEAMLNLAVVYRDGRGRPVNNVQALKWFLLARAFNNQNPALETTIANVRDKLKPAEVTTAEKEATAWRDNFVKEAQAAQQQAQAAPAPAPAAPPKK